MFNRRWLLFGILFLAIIALSFGTGWLVRRQVEINRQTSSQTAQAGPPRLIDPGGEAVYNDVSPIWLYWEWQQHTLAEGEVYEVKVWPDGQPDKSLIAQTPKNNFDVRSWLLDQKPGNFFWTVRVLQSGKPDQPVTDAATPQRFTVKRTMLDIVQVQEGFASQLAARMSPPGPTVITFGPDDAMYVLFIGGEIARLTDQDGDHDYETVKMIYDDKDDNLSHAVGLAFYQGTIYVSDSGRISRLTDKDGDGILDTVTPIVEGLPSLLHPYHSNNGIAFGPDNKLYVTIGATTDHGPISKPLEASVLRMNPDGSDLEVFATGFRNSYDLAFSPSGELFSADNSPEHLDHQLQYLPPEELNLVVKGGNYGFPDVYGNNLGTRKDTIAPVTELPTSVASSGLTYYAAQQFPEAYRGIYLALFGTGFDNPRWDQVAGGDMVVFVKLEPKAEGGYTATWQPFASFKNKPLVYNPVDVTVGPDGALYILEWTTASVFRVSYVGPDIEATAEATDAATPNSQPASLGQQVFEQGVKGAPACNTCHTFGSQPGATVGPSLTELRDVAATRIPGLSAEDYVRQSIVSPNAYVVSGYQSGLMYQEYGKRLTPEQLDSLVAYLLSPAAR
jgi:glucose/arabinose dehydrogenase